MMKLTGGWPAMRGAMLTALLLVCWSVPAAAQSGSGGRLLARLSEDIDDGRMVWGGAVSSIDGSSGLRGGGLGEAERETLIRRLRERGGSGAYVEITGGDATVRFARVGHERVRLVITDTPGGARSRGHAEARRPAPGTVPVLFVLNNVQREFVIETPAWLEYVTVVVNGRVIEDARRVVPEN